MIGFQSTRPSRGETKRYGALLCGKRISIHSPLAGRDGYMSSGMYLDWGISIHSPLAGRDSHALILVITHPLFQSTRPSRGETTRAQQGQKVIPISIHSPLAGRDQKPYIFYIFLCIFQSTRPSRGETSAGTYGAAGGKFQSTRPSRGETRVVDCVCAFDIISIHSPLAGRDTNRGRRIKADWHFNPLAPRGARPMIRLWAYSLTIFQSTRPSRGETHKVPLGPKAKKISIHSPLAGRDHTGYNILCRIKISIHSPLAGRDLFPLSQFSTVTYFNPLAPRGARQRGPWKWKWVYVISIHSPLAGRDTDKGRAGCERAYFNPLAPRGARPACRAIPSMLGDISIHSPLAGRDAQKQALMLKLDRISIHSPLAGRDHTIVPRNDLRWQFQSTRPSRGETMSSLLMPLSFLIFQSTRPSRGETKITSQRWTHAGISIHSPLAGRDRTGRADHR